MCGRYASFMARNDIQLAFDLDSLGPETEGLAPSWNVAPTQNIAIIVERLLKNEDLAPASHGASASGTLTESVDGAAASRAPAADGPSPRQLLGISRELHVARWGLVPPWAKDLAGGPPMFNARIETVAEKRTFAPSLKNRRCIIPANGYFEWQSGSGGKIPHYMHYADNSPLAFAGLYSWWKAPDGSWLLSATIITKEAEGPMSRIHDRIPAILRAEDYDQWLDPHLNDPLAARAIVEIEGPELTADIVGTNVGNTRNNAPENIVPVEH